MSSNVFYLFQDRAAIKKGKKMPGHMGGDWSTLRGLKVSIISLTLSLPC